VLLCLLALGSEELLQLAKQRLESFAYVGATSKLQQSIEELVSALGLSFNQTAHPLTQVSTVQITNDPAVLIWPRLS
jgi:hypothetical protein